MSLLSYVTTSCHPGDVLTDRTRREWLATNILPHEAEVRGWLRRNLRSLKAQDIDDLVQEAYACLLTIDYTTITNGRSYLFTTIRHLLERQARRTRIVPMERMGEIESLSLPVDELSPERRISARQELERLEQVMNALPPQALRAFQLRKFHGLSQREIANEMRIAEKTVEKHLATALSRILKGLDEPAADAPDRKRTESGHDRHSKD